MKTNNPPHGESTFWLNLANNWRPSPVESYSSIHTTSEKMYHDAEASMQKRIDTMKKSLPTLEKTHDKGYQRSNRYFDTMAEQEVAKFLDKYLYPRIKADIPFSFQRETERENQLRGIDETLTIKKTKRKIYIDEKAAVHYINSPLPSFAFECSFDRYQDDTPIHTTGWLWNENLLTGIYLLIYVSVDEKIAPPQKGSNEYYKTLEADDITRAQCFFICRNTIKRYLRKHGFCKYEIEDAVQKIREGIPAKSLTNPSEQFHFHYSSDLVEKPINIIFKKSMLEELSTWIIDVRPSGNTILKGAK